MLLKRLLPLILVGLLTLPALAQEGHEGSETEQVVEVLGKVEVQVHFKGKTKKLKGRATTLDDELMVKADARLLDQIAKHFGRKLKWSGNDLTLSSDNDVSLRLGQKRLPDNDEGRVLNPEPRIIDGAVHVPLSALEELLDVRLTFKEKKVFVEPVITAVNLTGEGRNLKLEVEATGPVKFKTFTLKQPDRYVIDIPGAVLDTVSREIPHPTLGKIRLGQFELGPSISRIVIPTGSGVAVSQSGQQFALRLPKNPTTPVQGIDRQKITEVKLDNIHGGKRLELSISGPVQYQWTRLRAPDHRFFLDIPNAVLVGKKKTIEVNDKMLGRVRLSQFQPEPKPVVRMVLDLKAAANLRILSGEGENSLAVEVMHKKVDLRYAATKGYGTTDFPEHGHVICIDPGHGGSDPGAINRSVGVREAHVTLDISKRLAAILRRQGWNVVMTRDSDRDVSWAGSSAKQELGARARVANDLNADLFLSIHCNASVNPGSHGTSLHYYKRADRVLASSLWGAVMAGTGRKDRGLIRNRFYVLSHTKMPAVLVETAFLTNRTEGNLLAKPEYRQRVAESIAEGLRGYASTHLERATAANR